MIFHSTHRVTRTLPFSIIGGMLFSFSANAQATSELAKGLASPAVAAIFVIFYILREISIYIIGVAAALLDTFFYINIGTVPSGISIVPIGWAALRDLTNGAFLLIILWIALTIIFNIEQWGGKRLLINVIMVALLINFSLLMVTMVFGVANQLAAIFANNMPKDPGTFIVKAIDIQSMGDVASPSRIEALKAEEARRTSETQRQIELRTETGSPIKDTLLASMGVPSANAQLGGASAGCAAAILAGAVAAPVTGGISLLSGSALCVGGAVLGGISDWIFGWFTGLFDKLVSASVRMFTQTIFILFAAVTMFLGAVTLLIRYGVMIALSILAPLAFLAATIPTMKRFFDLWLSTLLRWAFFVPLFYLMMYISLFIISGVSARAPVGFGPSGSFDRILIAFVGLLFMWMGLRIARQTGGAVADSAVSGIAKLGLFAAGGAAGLAMRGAGAAIAAQPERAQEWAARARRFPLFGRQIQRAMSIPMERNRQDVEARAKEIENYPTDWLVTHFRKTENSKEKAAAAILLARRKKTSKLDRPGERQQAVAYTKQFGLHKDVIKENPHLVTPDMVPEAKGDRLKAIMKVMKDVTDKLSLPSEAYGDKETMLALIANIRGKKEIKKIRDESPELFKEIVRIVNDDREGMNKIITILNEESIGTQQRGEVLRETLNRYINAAPGNRI